MTPKAQQLQTLITLITGVLGVTPDEFGTFRRDFNIARPAPWSTPATAASVEVKASLHTDKSPSYFTFNVHVSATTAMTSDVGTMGKYAASLQRAVALASEVEALVQLDTWTHEEWQQVVETIDG